MMIVLCGSESELNRKKKYNGEKPAFPYQQLCLPRAFKGVREDWEEMEKIEKENIGDFFVKFKNGGEYANVLSVSC